MILASRDDLIDQVCQLERQGVEAQGQGRDDCFARADRVVTFQIMPTYLPCVGCGGDISSDEVSWFYMLFSGPVRMHHRCFEVFYRRGWAGDLGQLEAMRASVDDFGGGQR